MRALGAAAIGWTAAVCAGCARPTGVDEPVVRPGWPETTGFEEPPLVDSGAGSPAPSLAPVLLGLYSTLGFDPATMAGGYSVSDGVVAPASVRISLYDAAFWGDLPDEGPGPHACRSRAVARDLSAPIPAVRAAWTEGGVDADELTFTLSAGSFDVIDDPDEDAGIVGCSAVDVDPARFPDGFERWMAERDWQIGYGAMNEALLAQLSADPEPPLGAGYLAYDWVLGGSVCARAPSAPSPRCAMSMLSIARPMDGDREVDEDSVVWAPAMWPDPVVPARIEVFDPYFTAIDVLAPTPSAGPW